MKKLDFNVTKGSHSDDEEEVKEFEASEVKAQIETIQAYNKMLSKMEVNEKVMNADIHELFLFFNLAFFNNALDCVILEWSNRMTLCAGICYYQVPLSPLLYYRVACAPSDWVSSCWSTGQRRICKRLSSMKWYMLTSSSLSEAILEMELMAMVLYYTLHRVNDYRISKRRWKRSML